MKVGLQTEVMGPNRGEICKVGLQTEVMGPKRGEICKVGLQTEVLGPKRGEISGYWSKIHMEQLYDLLSLSHNI